MWHSRAKHRHFLAGCSDRGIAPDRALMESGDRASPSPTHPFDPDYRPLITATLICPTATCIGVRRGSTEKNALLYSIDTDNVAGLRDRAMVGLKVCSFGHIGAARGMAVKNVHTKNRGLWVLLREPERGGVFPNHAANRGGVHVPPFLLQLPLSFSGLFAVDRQTIDAGDAECLKSVSAQDRMSLGVQSSDSTPGGGEHNQG
jgi:hypothetical protein